LLFAKIQQNTKKANKLHQEMKRKIAKLESKIKSMDKVTVRRGTQTDDQLDKVYFPVPNSERKLGFTATALTIFTQACNTVLTQNVCDKIYNFTWNFVIQFYSNSERKLVIQFRNTILDLL